MYIHFNQMKTSKRYKERLSYGVIRPKLTFKETHTKKKDNTRNPPS